MSNKHLIEAIKKCKGRLISVGIIAISNILVGISLFDKNYKLGQVGHIVGIIPLVCFSSCLLQKV